jgi:hypothetical protein
VIDSVSDYFHIFFGPIQSKNTKKDTWDWEKAMSITRRLKVLFYFLTLIVFVTQLALPTGARAEGEAPPAGVDTSIPPDTAPADLLEPGTPVTTEPPTGEIPTELALDMATLPDETALVVLDENGQTLSLATVEAAAVVASGDPIWCPTSVAPIPGEGGCTGSFDTFNGEDGLIAALNAGPYSGAGTIYIRDNYSAVGADFGTSIIFVQSEPDPSDVWDTTPRLANLTDLVFQGGWDGTSNISQTFSTTTFNLDNYTKADGQNSFASGLRFINWDHSLTLNNITITNTSNGLEINTIECVVTAGVYDDDCIPEAEVTLNDVAITLSGRDAIAGVANASEAADIDTSGNVAVNNSSFSSNLLQGLNIFSGLGAITLNNVVASSNAEGGAGLSAGYDTGVFLTGTNVFNGNSGTGLAVENSGDFTADISSHLTANNNYTDGLYISNVGDAEASGSDVSLLGTNTFTGNGTGGYVGSGFYIEVAGNIELNNVTASNNYNDYGAYLDNCLVDEESDTGDCTGTGSVTLTGVNTFNENGNGGLYVMTNGDITLANVTAGYYYYDPAKEAENYWGDYYGNGLGGAELYTYNGDVSITDSVFSANTAFGLYVETGGSYGPEYNWDYEYRTDRCAEVGDLGCDISLTNVTAEYNMEDYNEYGYGDGAQLFTTYGGDVTVDDSFFNENEATGLVVDSGAELYTEGSWEYDEYDGSSYFQGDWDAAESIETCVNGSCDITITDVQANYNNYRGIAAYSNLGDITLDGVTAGYIDFEVENWEENDDAWFGNGGTGADLGTNEGTISVTDSNFQGNGYDGLEASADYGNIVVDNVHSDYNYNGAGADLWNNNGGDITVEDSYFDNNGNAGLYVYAGDDDYCDDGWTCNITLSNIEANDNYDDAGAELWSYEGTITVSDSEFSYNEYYTGLDAWTGYGDIVIENVTADENEYGADLGNDYGGDITITGSFFNTNYYAGLEVDAGYEYCDDDACNITLSDVEASDNSDGDGADLWSDEGTITVSDSEFSYNEYTGLDAWTGYGDIVIENVTADENEYGANLGNDYGGDITVTGSFFNTNYYGGLEVDAGYEYCDDDACNITLSDVEASDNSDGIGADLRSDLGNVNVSYSSFNNNPVHGLYISLGRDEVDLYTINLDHVTANENDMDGFAFYGPDIDGPGKSDSADITISSSTFSNNIEYGLEIINCGGTNTLSGVTTTGNNVGGVQNYIIPDPFTGECVISDLPPEPSLEPDNGTDNVFPRQEGRKLYQSFLMDGLTEAGFSCGDYFGLFLYTGVAGDYVVIPCGSRGTGNHAFASNVEGDSLSMLPAGTFTSALQFSLQNQNHKENQFVNGALVSFVLPEGEAAAGYSILFWNGLQWETVQGSQLVNGHFQAWVDQTGTYVLMKN